MWFFFDIDPRLQHDIKIVLEQSLPSNSTHVQQSLAFFIELKLCVSSSSKIGFPTSSADSNYTKIDIMTPR